jgi:hypothetical protein
MSSPGSPTGTGAGTGGGGSAQTKPVLDRRDTLKPNTGLFKHIINELKPAIPLSGGSILQLLSSLSPMYLSVFFILSLAAMTTDAKFEKNSDGKFDSSFYKRECNFVSFPYGLSEYTIPNFNSTALSFIFAYIYLPMVQFESYNLVLLAVIIVLFFIDAVTKVMNGCTPIVGILMGLAIGWIVAYLWYLIVAGANSNLIYFNNSNTNPICSRPNNQTFKCKVYKNGEIIHTM